MKRSNLSFLLKTVFITVFFLAGFSAHAQSSFNVKVKFVDTNTNEGIAGATASLTVKGEEKPLPFAIIKNPLCGNDRDSCPEIAEIAL